MAQGQEKISISKLVNNLRLDKAKALLKETNKNVSEISFEIGFGEPPYFIKLFKDREGLTPGEFRQKVSNG